MTEEAKEKLTEEGVENSEVESTEENVEDYFNPFAEEASEEDKKIEEDIKEEEGEKEEKKETIDGDVKVELAEIKAQNQATRDVAKFMQEHPEFSEMGDDLVDLASKAIVRGHSKPLEFAVRNIKSPEYWIDYGKKIAREDLSEVNQNRVGGSSLPSKGESKADFSRMSASEFNDYVSGVKSNT